MRDRPTDFMEDGRKQLKGFRETNRGDLFGAFFVKCPSTNRKVFVVSSGKRDDWEHVSVSLEKSIPSWKEMSWVKEQFFRDDETVVQFHPKKSDYVNINEYCLHLWRKVGSEYQLPPQMYV